MPNSTTRKKCSRKSGNHSPSKGPSKARRAQKKRAFQNRVIAASIGVLTALLFATFIVLHETPNRPLPNAEVTEKRTAQSYSDLQFSKISQDKYFHSTPKTPVTQRKIEDATKQPINAARPKALSFDKPAIALVIDDLGHQWQSATQLTDSTHAITLAILPFSPYGQKIAKTGHQKGKEIILHAPMEPTDKSSWGGGLSKDMTTAQLQQSLYDMINWLPHVVGVNNHMGSELTTHRQHMNDIMFALSQRQLFFLDSRTNPATQALKAAQAHHIPSTRRDVFLDNVRDVEAIEIQFQKLVRVAKKNGIAVGIGHPYPETLAFIEHKLPNYLDQVVLVPLSSIIEMNINKLAHNNTDKIAPKM